MHSDHRDGREHFAGEIAVAHGVHAVLRDRGEPEFARDEFAVEIDGRARNGAGAERHHVDAFAGVVEAVAIALKHLDVSEQMMGEQHRLRALEMRVAGNDHVAVAEAEPDEASLQGAQAGLDFPGLVAQIEAQVERDLVVAAASRVEFRTRVADPSG